MATLTNQIKALIDFANETTGKADTRLGDAVKSLADGYKGGGRLPSEYQEVEYLESANETSFVQFEFDLRKSDVLLFDMWISPIYTKDTIFLQTGGGLSIGRGWRGDSLFAMNFNNPNYFLWNKGKDGDWHTFNIKLDGGNPFTIDGDKYNNHDEGVTPVEGVSFLRLFKSYEKARFKPFVVRRNGEDRLNLVPCYRKSDNKPGIYDLVNGEFLVNQGIGEFVVGPDVN